MPGSCEWGKIVLFGIFMIRYGSTNYYIGESRMLLHRQGVTVISFILARRIHFFLVFSNIVVLEFVQEQKATLCQRTSKSVSKWPRKMCTDIFVFIIVEINTRSLNGYPASDQL